MTGEIPYRGLLFDLDGVLVDTNPLHYQAWKELTEELSIPFTPEDNRRLLGISRAQCLEILLELGNRTLSQPEKDALCHRKNQRYRELICNLTPENLLPGASEFLRAAREQGFRIALGSVSKNAGYVLQKLEIRELFDAVIDGTQITRGKPDPEVFRKGAEALCLSPRQCVVFEDSAAGIEAAHRGGMRAVGIGTPQQLPQADLTIPGFHQVSPTRLLRRLHHPAYSEKAETGHPFLENSR